MVSKYVRTLSPQTHLSLSKKSQARPSIAGSDLSVPRSAGRSPGEQATITCSPQVVKSSIDTLHISLWVDLSKSDILEKISIARDLARECELDKIPFTHNSTDFNVHRSGKRHFQYHISTADTHIYFNKRDVNGSFPTCIIEIGSMSSWCPGPFKVFRNIKSYFDFSKIEVVKHNISRVDLCSDFIGSDFDKLDLINVKKWIKRANKFAVYYNGNNSTGLSVGSGDIMLRIYDKTAELKQKKATAKEEFFQKIWGTKTKPVVRVEFQFRRACLKEFSFGPDNNVEIHTIDELEKAQNVLWHYGCTNWARHCKKEVDKSNKNHKQSKPSKFWLQVQGVSFNKISKTGIRKKRPRTFVNVEALKAQAAGCMMAVAACYMDTAENISECIRIAKDSLSETIFLNYLNNSTDFVKKIATVQAVNKFQFSM